MEEKIYMVSYSYKRAWDWVNKNEFSPSQMHVISYWKQIMGIDGRNKVLHIIPGSFHLWDYSVILDYAREDGWAIKHVDY